MLRTPLHRPDRRRRAVIVAFVALSLIGLVGVAAIAIDGGLLYLELRKTRAGADAAAMAAACDLYKNYPANNGIDVGGTAKQAALGVAASNGFTNDGTSSTVVVNIPPLSGPYQGDAGYAEVIITYNVQRGFSRVFGSAPLPVVARAVSRGAWVSPNAGVIILDYTSKSALNTQGNGAFTEVGGPVIVNSNNASAEVSSGNGTFTSPEFDITGGVSFNGSNANLITTPVPGQVYTGTHPTPDPLAYLMPPDPTTLPAGTITKVSLGGGGTQYTLTPGVYTNLPNFTSGDVVILQQASANAGGGIFYINGGGFKSTGATITMDPATSGGVMLYNAPASSANSEKIQITGNSSGSVNLAPLSSGPYTGMSIWQDRNSSVPVQVDGNGYFQVTGTFYAAGAPLSISGNGTSSTGYYLDASGNQVFGVSQIGSQYVSHDLSLTGNGNININYSGPLKAKTRIITLVE
jgi:hypothetical protein